MTDFHEPADTLSDAVKDTHRALTSLKEEIEAVDWYSQRVECCKDASLRGILEHNRDEEIEHACMTLEWLRRNHPKWNDHLSRYLFIASEIVDESPEPLAQGSNPVNGQGQ